MQLFQKSVLNKYLNQLNVSEVDQMVYELYDLTNEEIKIVEESTNY